MSSEVSNSGNNRAKPYAYQLDTVSDAERALFMQGQSPILLYRYWRDGEAEWRRFPGQPHETVMTSRTDTPWADISALEAFCENPGTGHWVGYLAYDLGERELIGSTKTSELPLVHLAYYPLLQDESGSSPEDLIPATAVRKSSPRAARLSAPTPLSLSDYLAAIDRIRQYLEAGDVYQVNYTQGFSARTTMAPPILYHRLCRINPAPYSAYLDCGDFAILSSSPECFLRLRGRDIYTAPIKGTIGRGATPDEDEAQRRLLLSNAKDNAELLMICDLERNDLGKVCMPGSIRVSDICKLETFATVHHLVATIHGTLQPEISHTEALRACFPGGSITGAPKKRAMEIIAELEREPRGIYTGCVGYFGRKIPGQAARESQWSIAIRTIVHQDDLAVFASGGGITIGSNAAAEYAESLLKAQALQNAFKISAESADAARESTRP